MASMFDDGMTLDFTYEPRGPYDALTGKYRLATPERAAEWHFDAYDKARNGKDRHKANLAFVVEHVLAWSDARPINEESIKRMPQPCLVYLCNLIAGYSFEERQRSEKN
jgi:hypothetical protein